MDEQIIETTQVVSTDSTLFALLATFGVFAIVFGIAWFILQVIAYMRIFQKAGKPGWHSVIPFLQDWDKIDLSWSSTVAWVYICATLIANIFANLPGAVRVDPEGRYVTFGVLGIIAIVASVVVLVITIISEYKLAKAFGKGFGFFLGLLFLNPIFKLILGFGDARYQGRQ